MLQDITELRAMQLGICGYGRESAMPGGVEHVEIVDGVLGGDRNPVARLQPKAVAQCAGEPRGAAGKLTIAAHHLLAPADSGQSGMAKARALEPQREIHSAIPRCCCSPAAPRSR